MREARIPTARDLLSLRNRRQGKAYVMAQGALIVVKGLMAWQLVAE